MRIRKTIERVCEWPECGKVFPAKVDEVIQAGESKPLPLRPPSRRADHQPGNHGHEDPEIHGAPKRDPDHRLKQVAAILGTNIQTLFPKNQ